MHVADIFTGGLLESCINISGRSLTLILTCIKDTQVGVQSRAEGDTYWRKDVSTSKKTKYKSGYLMNKQAVLRGK